MTITQEELQKLIQVKSQIDKITKLSYDGKNLLTRVPKEIKDYIELKKGDRFRWIVDNNKKIQIESINLQK
jgi:hypothetical protein